MKTAVCQVCQLEYTHDRPPSRVRKTCGKKECLLALKPATHKGKRLSESAKAKVSKANKGRRLTFEQRMAKSCPGSKNGRWIDGRSKVADELAYLNFTKARKRDIKERDGNVCQVCGKSEKGLNVHHIDADKQNDRDDNFITLCASCHSLVHGREKPAQGDLDLFEDLRSKL